MSDPQGFLKFKRVDPSRRAPDERVKDWKEFYLPVSEPKIKDQASRCMDCGVPFCQGPTGCPLQNVIPQWNDWTHQGRWREALDRLHMTNNFPEFTGRLCPAPCESACVLGVNDSPVTIRLIENEIAEKGFAEGWVLPVKSARQRTEKIAVVGSGPAGLAAAQQLARTGFAVTVFEKADKPGGLLRYGIPDFKMEKSVLDRRLSQLISEGVEFKCGVNVGTDLSVQALVQDFSAVCLTIGAEKPRDIQIPGRDLDGVWLAMDFLIAENVRQHSGETHSWLSGKKVIVIGGGDTGSDCIGTAHRLGASDVIQLEILPEPPVLRDSSTPWPMWPLKLRVSHAHEEGVVRDWSVRTLEFLGDKGLVRGLKLQRLQWEAGRPVPVEDSEFDLSADLVVLATGFQGVGKSPWLDLLGVRVRSTGSLEVDDSYKTKVKGVFAAGDAKRGASLIVWAIAEGRQMASRVEAYLNDDSRSWPKP